MFIHLLGRLSSDLVRVPRVLHLFDLFERLELYEQNYRVDLLLVEFLYRRYAYI